MKFDTRPDPTELARWFAQQPPTHREFFKDRGQLGIPFAWHGGYPGPFAAAALLNPEVQENIREFPRVWSEASVRRAPPMRWEFEFVVAFGGMEIVGWCKNKSGWGDLLWVSPVLPEDPVHPQYLECVHNPESKFRRALDQRMWMKKKLGKKHRALVGKARKFTKVDFVWEIENASLRVPQIMAKKAAGKVAFVLFPADSKQVIRLRLGMDPGTFWQHARGKPLPAGTMNEPQQLALFEE